MKYRISEVKCRRDLMRFIKFPDELYRGCRQYVPALHSDQVNSLTSVSTLSYCTRKMWIATEGDRVVGRICGMVNPRYNERYGTARARFGWFDTIDDLEVASLLLGTAEEWARSQGMNEIHGPLYYNTLGKQGMLVEGFDNTPPFNCIYNYPYYSGLVERLGYVKECDWVQYRLPAGQGMSEKAGRVAAVLSERYRLHSVDIGALAGDKGRVRDFFDTYNRSFAASVYNFIPFTDEEIEEEMKSVRRFISDKSCCILCDENEKVAAFGISFPSISEALKKARGRLFPFGWFHILRAMHDYSTCDLMLSGASPEWQNRGVSALYFKEMAEKARKSGMQWAITNPQIESNSAVNIWKEYQRELFMRRRCYIKQI